MLDARLGAGLVSRAGRSVTWMPDGAPTRRWLFASIDSRPGATRIRLDEGLVPEAAKLPFRATASPGSSSPSFLKLTLHPDKTRIAETGVHKDGFVSAEGISSRRAARTGRRP